MASRILEFAALIRHYESSGEGLREIEAVFKALNDFENFWHYLADADIRAKDPDYAAMQNKALNGFCDALENEDIQVARRISFLGS